MPHYPEPISASQPKDTINSLLTACLLLAADTESSTYRTLRRMEATSDTECSAQLCKASTPPEYSVIDKLRIIRECLHQTRANAVRIEEELGE